VKDEAEPVSEDEFVFRRILKDYVDEALESPVLAAAFRPTDKDTDGISFYREACGATPEAIVASAPGRYYVARLSVAEIGDISIVGSAVRLRLRPTAQAEGPRGHASMWMMDTKLRDESKAVYRQLAQALASLCRGKIVLRPA
jgi:hypothetical protein